MGRVFASPCPEGLEVAHTQVGAGTLFGDLRDKADDVMALSF